MGKSIRIYSVGHLASAVFMMAALLWLTISVAFIVPAQQEFSKQDFSATSQDCTGADEDDSNPFGNTNEEKASGNTSFSEEYLHNHHHADHFFSLDITIHTSRDFGTYNAFHGEVHVPPPNIA